MTPGAGVTPIPQATARPPGRVSVTIGARGYWAEVSGFKARELLVETGCKSPLWLPRRRAWSTSARRAGDVIALAESRGIKVIVIDGAGGDS